MPFRLASLNATNLNAPGLGFIGRPDTRPLKAEEYAARTAALAAHLEALKADLIGVQEVFSETALREAVAAAPAMAGAEVHAPLSRHVPDPDGEGEVGNGPHVGLISRLPLAGPVTMIESFRPEVLPILPAGLHNAVSELHLLGITRYERPVLRAEPVVPGLPGLVVLVAHLKSKRGRLLPGEFRDDPVVQAMGEMRSLVVRACEAAALRAQVVAERDGWAADRRRPVVVLGDLNDDLGSVTTQMICGDRPFLRPGEDAVPRSVYRSRTRTMMVSAFDIVAPPAGQGHSHVHDGKGSLIDHILMSADFAPVVGRQRARVLATGCVNAHLPPASAAPPLPPVEPFDPAAVQARLREEAERAPRDPLTEGAPGRRRQAPDLDFDHGFPYADVEVLTA